MGNSNLKETLTPSSNNINLIHILSAGIYYVHNLMVTQSYSKNKLWTTAIAVNSSTGKMNRRTLAPEVGLTS